MAYDPVLDRPMFQTRSSAKGIPAVDTSSDASDQANSDYKTRKEQADALIEMAKKKFDPSNFQTLTEQDRPDVFRPVAVNMPAAQQTASTAQRMQQMAGQGVQQPVQMAKGGPVYGYAGGTEVTPDGPMASVYDENGNDITSVDYLKSLGNQFKQIKSDVEGIKSLPQPKENKIAPTASTRKGGALPSEDASTWTDSDIENLADDIVSRGTQAKTPFARGIQSLNPFHTTPNRDEVVQRLRNERDQEIAAKSNAPSSIVPATRDEDMAKAQADYQTKLQAIEKAKAENPVPSIFSEQTPEEYQAAQSKQAAAIGSALSDVSNPPNQYTSQTLNALSPSTESAAVPPVSTPDMTSTTPSQTVNAVSPATEGVAVPPVSTPDMAGSAPSQTLNAASPSTETVPSVGATDTTSTGAGTTGAGTTGAGAPSPAAPPSGVPNVDIPDVGQTAPMSLAEIKAERQRQRDENINMGLIQAGLAIAGGRSSNALVNIGEGAQTGVKTFLTGEQEARQAMRENVADLRAQQQLQLDAAYKKASLANASAQLGISQQDVALRRDQLQQSLNEFNTNIDLKKQEFQNNIQVAVANRDAKMAESLTNSLTTQINAVQAARSRIASNVQMSIMSPDAAKMEEDRLNQQELQLRQQADYLRTKMAQSAGINLPSVAAQGLPANTQAPISWNSLK